MKSGLSRISGGASSLRLARALRRVSLASVATVGVGALASASLLAFLAGTEACVPTGNAPPYDAGSAAPTAPTVRPSVNVMTAPFEDNFDRPDASDEPLLGDAATPTAATATASAAASAKPGDGGKALLPTLGRDGSTESQPVALGADGGEDAGARVVDTSNLGPNWTAVRTNAWRVENGKLCVQNAHNHPVWLNRTLPVNARIEFDATAWTDDGDLKAEVWGDGRSAATGTSYTNATSYLAVLGGWKNTLQVLARLNEHGTDRKEIHIDKDSDDPRQRAVMKGQSYHFKIERTDGKTIRWFVDGVEYLSWTDPSPLAGQGHDHFGFNEWEAKVCFDNVKVTPL